MRKIFNARNFKGIVSPHEFLQVKLPPIINIIIIINNQQYIEIDQGEIDRR